jgi:HPt (histidine-containing phosphotransfer) domain-containing protein
VNEAQLDQHLAEIFFLESAEMLSDASLTLLGAEAAGNPSEAIHKVFRAVHSIKGGAQSLGFEELAKVAHCMEAFMVPFQHGKDAADGQTVSLMLESMDVIEDQLKAYQSGEMPGKNRDFLVKLAEATALFIGNRTDISSDNVILSEKKARNHKSRLLYLSFIVDQAATMPSMTAFLLLDRLRSSGQLLYSQPDIDHSSTTAEGKSLTQVAIIDTDMSNAAVKQEAYRVGDILDIKISEIDGKKKPNTEQPTKEEISTLSCLVSMMWKELCNKKSNKGHVKDLARQITAWGAASRGAAGWFQGGLPAWKRLTSLLTDTVSLKESATLTGTERSLALKALRVSWEAVYNALCDQTYFYSFVASDMLSGNGLQVITELEAREGDSQLIIIDFSSWEILEAKHLKTLARIKNKIEENGWDLRLISEGEYTRRHSNVLEISKNIVGQLDFYSSIYNAVITRENCD